MNYLTQNTTMKRLTQLSLLLVCMLLAQPIAAKWHTDIQKLEEALKSFINDKSVSLSDPRIIARGQPIDKKTFNVKETDWCVDFTCTDDELVTNLWKKFMTHLDNTSYFYCSNELHPKTEPWMGLKLDNMEDIIVLTSNYKNVYVLTFEDKDGNDNGFYLSWNDLQNGRKEGNLMRFIGNNPRPIKLITSENRIAKIGRAHV